MAPTEGAYPTPAVSLTKHPATLPRAEIPDDIDHAAVAASALEQMNDRISVGRLAENVIWRDSLAITGTLRTFYSPSLVAHVWHDLSRRRRPCSFKLSLGSSQVVRAGCGVAWVEAKFEFHVYGPRSARCSGVIGLVPAKGREGTEWKIWLLCTILEQVDGWPDVDGLVPGHSTFADCGLEEGNDASSTARTNGQALSKGSSIAPLLDCLVVGGGMGGLCMAGRLKALGLSYLAVEKHEQVGDVWLKDRYESVKLHTSKEYSQMPGTPRTFGPDCPYHLTGKDLVDGFQRYANNFGINVWTSTLLESAEWDGEKEAWKVRLCKHGEKHVVMHVRHIVLATGNNGIKPKMHTYPNRDRFKGDIVHAGHWRNASPWRGRRGIVIGSANTAHDVIADMVKANFTSVTMIQRGKTFVLPMSTFGALVDPVFNEARPTEEANRLLLAYPLPIQRLLAMAGIRACAEQKEEYFDALEARGMKVERYGDLWGLIYDHEGGHFFDLGSGQLIIDGKVKVRSDALPVTYTETGLELSDGSRLDADVVVFATGYEGSMRYTAAQIFGEEIAGGLQEFWQCDAEGESRGAWRDTGRKSLRSLLYLCVTW